jgi:MYXO-CTERM domain-containing protein
MTAPRRPRPIPPPLLALAFCLALPLFVPSSSSATPLYVTHHWHMHQPIYWPYESVVDTELGGGYGFSVNTVHQDRTGPYTSWPINAVEAGMNAGFDHIGAQVSLSGSLMENLDNLEAEGWGYQGWQNRWQEGLGWQTSEGNNRLYLVSFGYHHPLMALISPMALELQVEMHALAVERRFGQPPGPGMFPPESAFSPRMIPALVEAGVEWIMVDSIHLERSHVDYPWSSGSNLVPPNDADRLNFHETDWVNLQNIWAPSPVAAPWAYRPHYAVYIDPDTGEESRIIVVPSARYEGNEDARGGFGAFLYDPVLSSYQDSNDDPNHPMMAVLAHDGDNYGGGTDSYYGSNWGGYIDWLQGNGNFIGTTIQDYLDMYPPDPDDTLHVEDGAWSGADNGDAEFAKWNGDPDEDGYSPDRASWAVMTAALNHVETAEAIAAHTGVEGIVDGDGSATDLAWRWLLVGQTSCYWYWDGSEGGTWDSHPTRAANEAVGYAEDVIVGAGTDPAPPTIYMPQRQPYNPGAFEWTSSPESTEFEVWTFAYDVSGLASVDLHYRLDGDGCRDVNNEVYDSGSVQTVAMTATAVTSEANPAPVVISDGYAATIDTDPGTLVDYWVVATDVHGNEARSPIMHTAVGSLGLAGAPDGGGGGPWEPADPGPDDAITISAGGPGQLHWGVDGWTVPAEVYQPAETVDFGDGQSVETPLTDPDGDGTWTATIGPFNDPSEAVSTINFVFHWDDGGWSSPDHTIVLGSGGDDDDDDDEPGECVPYYMGGEWVPGDDDDAVDDDDAADDDDVHPDDDDVVPDDDDVVPDDDDAAATDDDDGGVREQTTPSGVFLPGCECSSGGSSGGAGLLGLVLLAVIRRRK